MELGAKKRDKRTLSIMSGEKKIPEEGTYMLRTELVLALCSLVIFESPCEDHCDFGNPACQTLTP